MPLRAIYTGPMPKGMREVLEGAGIGFSIQSNFARAHALSVALAASNGWISTVAGGGRILRNHWSITSAGLTMLEHLLHEQTPPLRR